MMRTGAEGGEVDSADPILKMTCEDAYDEL